MLKYREMSSVKRTKIRPLMANNYFESMNIVGSE